MPARRECLFFTRNDPSQQWDWSPTADCRVSFYVSGWSWWSWSSFPALVILWFSPSLQSLQILTLEYCSVNCLVSCCSCEYIPSVSNVRRQMKQAGHMFTRFLIWSFLKFFSAFVKNANLTSIFMLFGHLFPIQTIIQQPITPTPNRVQGSMTNDAQPRQGVKAVVWEELCERQQIPVLSSVRLSTSWAATTSQTGDRVPDERLGET